MSVETAPITGAETGIGAGTALIFFMFFLWLAADLTKGR